MVFIYEFNLKGLKLLCHNIANKFNGNDKLISEYYDISGVMLDAVKKATSKNRKNKLRKAHDNWSETKVVPLGGNSFDLQGYNAATASRAQNKAKVMQGRAMLKNFGLAR